MELREALASRKELERRYDRAKQEKERLRSEMESLKEEKASLALALTKQRELNQQLTTDLEQLGGELILHEIEKLRKERELLAKEIEDLTQELLRQEFCEAAYKSDTCPMCLEREAQDEPVAPTQVEKQQDIPFSLEDRRVAFVGGLDSLVPYYQQIVECLGGIFCNHCGESSQGKKEIQSLVDRADVVFCPVDINSHNACRCVKKACKLTGKPCHFLRSSSLSMLRRELISFAQRRTEA
jgi:hypothetical protein